MLRQLDLRPERGSSPALVYVTWLHPPLDGQVEGTQPRAWEAARLLAELVAAGWAPRGGSVCHHSSWREVALGVTPSSREAS